MKADQDGGQGPGHWVSDRAYVGIAWQAYPWLITV